MFDLEPESSEDLVGKYMEEHPKWTVGEIRAAFPELHLESLTKKEIKEKYSTK